ncbi:uncharacterized protein DS421_12g373280 [Arachis hypogaea]|nr:uncharacterized protein DS421_12g373280 [Arachis hypogaea]
MSISHFFTVTCLRQFICVFHQDSIFLLIMFVSLNALYIAPNKPTSNGIINFVLF